MKFIFTCLNIAHLNELFCQFYNGWLHEILNQVQLTQLAAFLNKQEEKQQAMVIITS
jgi:hypothetical protein